MKVACTVWSGGKVRDNIKDLPITIQQLPFSSINYGTNTSFEGRMITEAILDAELDGTGPLHKTPIFPCCIFQYNEKINGEPGTPNYDLYQKALYCTTKRLYPNYCNTEWSVDKKSVQRDIDNKRSILAKLNADTKAKIVKWIKDNPKEAIMYRMKVVNDDIVIDEDVIVPVEIMSTMGKCKCSSSKIF